MTATKQQEAEDARLGPRVSSDPSPLPTEELTLRGNYVTLTGLTEADMPSLWHHLQLPGNTDLLAFVPIDSPQSQQELWQQFQNVRERGLILYAVKADPTRLGPTAPGSTPPAEHSETVGTLAYLDVQPAHRALEVGAVLFSSLLQRTYAATECHYLLLRHIMATLSPPYRRVVWKCNSLNTASRRAAERLGYVHEGIFRKHWIAKGRSRDSVWLSIVDDEWPVVKKALEEWLSPENFAGEGRQIKRLEDVRSDVRAKEFRLLDVM